jgi:hypothetical protein
MGRVNDDTLEALGSRRGRRRKRKLFPLYEREILGVNQRDQHRYSNGETLTAQRREHRPLTFSESIAYYGVFEHD